MLIIIITVTILAVIKAMILIIRLITLNKIATMIIIMIIP
jgi:hypothetical protein